MSSDHKLIIRREADYVGRKGRSRKLRNLDKKLHPFKQALEYTRALNATKIERIFAKPFVRALSGSNDTIWRLANVPKRLSLLASGDCEGKLVVWNVAHSKLEWKAEAHAGFVRGLSVDPAGDKIVTCGTDKRICVWSINSTEMFADGKVQPLSSVKTKEALMDCDWQNKSNMFATAGETVSLWDESRNDPLHSFRWGTSTCGSVKFNRVETDLLFATSSERAVVLFDTRTRTPAKKIIMKMVANSVSWNPMEAANFVIASEDTNVYSFDMRKMDKPKVVHEDHLNAVMSVDFSPTGEEFVSGSYDKTVRIFKVNQYKSREVYFNKRMQRVFAAKFSLDGRFVFSGSDDTNIRVWKAVASEKMGILSKSESKSMDYCDKIKAKFRHMPQIKRISRHRQLPKSIYNAQKLKRTIKNAKKVRIQKYEERTKKPFPHRKNKKGVFAVID